MAGVRGQDLRILIGNGTHKQLRSTDGKANGFLWNRFVVGGGIPQRTTKNRKPLGRFDDHATIKLVVNIELQLVDIVDTFISYSRMAL